MDADGWKHIFGSTYYGTVVIDFCKAFAATIKQLCIEKCDHTELQCFLSCRLIPLDKHLGVSPIEIYEILRRIASKVVMYIARLDVMHSAGSLQTVCASQTAGCEASIHAMNNIYKENDVEAVILVAASNAFNSINREGFLHNVVSNNCNLHTQLLQW